VTTHLILTAAVNAPLLGVIIGATIATHRARRRLALMKPEVAR
jgi:hypothetical protein